MGTTGCTQPAHIELKKLPGHENPADLLTKHSLTRDRVEGFTKLYDCYFRDGRAESAPAMRTGETQKQTIAKADQPRYEKPYNDHYYHGSREN